MQNSQEVRFLFTITFILLVSSFVVSSILPISMILSLRSIIDICSFILFVLTFINLALNKFILTNNHKHNVSLQKAFIPKPTAVVLISILILYFLFCVFEIEFIGGELIMEDDIYSIISNGNLVRLINAEQFIFYSKIVLIQEIQLIVMLCLINLFVHLL